MVPCWIGYSLSSTFLQVHPKTPTCKTPTCVFLCLISSNFLTHVFCASYIPPSSVVGWEDFTLMTDVCSCRPSFCTLCYLIYSFLQTKLLLFPFTPPTPDRRAMRFRATWLGNYLTHPQPKQSSGCLILSSVSLQIFSDASLLRDSMLPPLSHARVAFKPGPLCRGFLFTVGRHTTPLHPTPGIPSLC